MADVLAELTRRGRGDVLIVTTDDKHYGDIADAIRDKLGTTDGYKPEDMAAAVGDIESGGGGWATPQNPFRA